MDQETEEVAAPLPPQYDVVMYTGQITMPGYDKLCKVLREKKASKVALLILATPGGNPHAGFRIARALGHHYDYFHALVPRYCKSAGTLILLGAKRLYLDDMSELGPLDVQVKKGDEIAGQNSGLEFLKAVDYLQTQSMAAFRTYLNELARGDGLSTRIASDIAAKLTAGLFEPLAAQIDPLKLAEMQRAMEIAYEYGTRLAETSDNVKPGGLRTLIAGYPSHGFVIDRKEAKKVFKDVKRPSEALLDELSDVMRDTMLRQTNAANPVIAVVQVTSDEGNKDGQPVSNAAGSAGSAQPSQSAVDGNIAGAEQGQQSAADTRTSSRPSAAAARPPRKSGAGTARATPVARKRPAAKKSQP